MTHYVTIASIRQVGTPIRSQQRTSARARRSANERAILDAAEALLADRSFHDLTVEDVMAATGLTRTAFYRYFPDLQAVLLRRLEEISDEIRVAAGRWLEADAAATGSLVEAARGLALVYQRHGRVLLAFSDAAVTGRDVEKAWRAMVETFIHPVTAQIVDLRRRGLSSVEHPTETAKALVWMVERYLLESYGRGGGVDPDVAATVLADVFRRTLLSG